MMLTAVIALSLLALLGRAGKTAGIDRLLKTPTTTKRTLSFVRQGIRWYELIPSMPGQRTELLMHLFQLLISTDPFLKEFF